MLELWMVKAEKQQAAGFVSAIRGEIQGLSNSVTLSTGLSMLILWEIIRPLVPSTLEVWNVHDELHALLAEFESNVAFQIGACHSV